MVPSSPTVDSNGFECCLSACPVGSSAGDGDWGWKGTLFEMTQLLAAPTDIFINRYHGAMDNLRAIPA